MSTVILDLGRYQSAGSKIFAGRERGAQVRDAAQLVDFERGTDTLEILVPPETYAVSSSFILALLGATIRKLGVAGFNERVKFTGKDIGSVVEQALWEAVEATKPFSLT